MTYVAAAILGWGLSYFVLKYVGMTYGLGAKQLVFLDLTGRVTFVALTSSGLDLPKMYPSSLPLLCQPNPFLSFYQFCELLILPVLN
jgi:hypothetical protein